MNPDDRIVRARMPVWVIPPIGEPYETTLELTYTLTEDYQILTHYHLQKPEHEKENKTHGSHPNLDRDQQ